MNVRSILSKLRSLCAIFPSYTHRTKELEWTPFLTSILHVVSTCSSFTLWVVMPSTAVWISEFLQREKEVGQDRGKGMTIKSPLERKVCEREKRERKGEKITVRWRNDESMRVNGLCNGNGGEEVGGRQ